MKKYIDQQFQHIQYFSELVNNKNIILLENQINEYKLRYHNWKKLDNKLTIGWKNK